jgi:predicted small metal-binding protein
MARSFDELPGLDMVTSCHRGAVSREAVNPNPTNDMKRTLLAAGATVFVACSMAVLGVAADKADSEEGGKAPVYSAKCPSPCNFSVKSHDKAEVAAILKEHAKTRHQKDLGDKDAEAMIKESKK